MIRIFKSVDEKISDIGFTKVRDDEYGVDYERTVNKYGFVHKVSIVRKKSGRHVLQSYDPNAYIRTCVGCADVGLTGYEAKLFIKKMKKIGLYSDKEATKI